MTYLDKLLDEASQRRAAGTLPKELTPDEVIDWAYGQAVQHNPGVTREMVKRAVHKRLLRAAGDEALSNPQNVHVLKELAKR